MKNSKIPDSQFLIPNCKIIALTANTLEKERQEILGAGCDDFLGKPLRESDLFDILQKHLGVRYIYEISEGDAKDDEKLAEADNAEPLVIGEALAMLPPEVLDELELASVQLNAHQVDHIIDTIAGQNPVLADELAILAKRFQYEQILSFIERARKLKDVSRSKSSLKAP
jgi:CheY-like chemotaxis protein